MVIICWKGDGVAVVWEFVMVNGVLCITASVPTCLNKIVDDDCRFLYV